MKRYRFKTDAEFEAEFNSQNISTQHEYGNWLSYFGFSDHFDNTFDLGGKVVPMYLLNDIYKKIEASGWNDCAYTGDLNERSKKWLKKALGLEDDICFYFYIRYSHITENRYGNIDSFNGVSKCYFIIERGVGYKIKSIYKEKGDEAEFSYIDKYGREIFVSSSNAKIILKRMLNKVK